MFDDQKRWRFRELQHRQDSGLITGEEKVELARLESEIENEEIAYLSPATAQMRDDSERLESQNRTLEELARRKEVLVERLRVFLEETRRERQAIDSELAAVLADDRNGHMEE